MLMMALLPPGELLGGYGGDPDGVNGSREKVYTCVSTSIRVRVALAAGEFAWLRKGKLVQHEAAERGKGRTGFHLLQADSGQKAFCPESR